MGRCQCSTAGFCNKFQRQMSKSDHEICNRQSKFGLDIRSQWQIDKLNAQGRIELDCIWKGEKLLDEHGFVRKRHSPACCGSAGGIVDLYKCEHPLIEEAETNCHLRCHYRAVLLPVESEAHAVSLTVTDFGSSESLATEGD